MLHRRQGVRESSSTATGTEAQFGEAGQGLYAARGSSRTDLIARCLGGAQRPSRAGLKPGRLGGPQRSARAGSIAGQLRGPRWPPSSPRAPCRLLLLGIVRFVGALYARCLLLTALALGLVPLARGRLVKGVGLSGQGHRS